MITPGSGEAPREQPGLVLNFTWKRLWIIVALVAIVFGRLILQVFLFRDGFLAITADDFGRIIQDAVPWVSDPSTIHLYGVWLPFYKIIYGLGIIVYRNLLVTPRILSTIFGILSILLIYRTTKLLFHKTGIGIISATLFAFSPMGVWLASTSLSEMPYILFVLASLFYYLHYLNTRKSSYLYTSCLFLGLTTGLRYEGWWLGVFMSTYILFDQWRARKTKEGFRIPFGTIILSLALIWTFPICWMLGNYFHYQNPVWFIGDISNYKTRWYGVGIDYFQYLKTILRFDPVGLFLILVAFVISFRQKKTPSMKFYMVISLLPLILFIFLHGGRSEPPRNLLRYMAPYMICFYPLIGFISDRLIMVINMSIGRNAAISIAIILAILSGLIIEDFRYSNDPAALGVAVGEEIAHQREFVSVDAAMPVMIELIHWDFLAIHSGANDVDWIMYDRPTGLPGRDAPSLFVTDLDQALACINYYHIKLVVVKSEDIKNILTTELHLTPDNTINGYSFYKVIQYSFEIPDGIQCTLPMGANR
jgi:Dolichyl-phosphate-mannose-protein mannosyltransferase